MSAQDYTTKQPTYYCGVCSLPPEFCEFGSNVEECLNWNKKNSPNFFEEFTAAVDRVSLQAESKPQTRGGKGRVKLPKKVNKDENSPIILFKQQRNKRKFITFIEGLEASGIDIKQAAKFFGSKFACGASVVATGKSQAVAIQGDFLAELPQLLIEEYKVDPGIIKVK
ncbi:uncharacterized protein LOC135145638 [Zophobas morio]|uniref:uncharacterized protein LOC135145638 n=1 Tax=Zophobas morio TaxID=2755281 RepID=UPI00308364AB